MRTVLSLGEGSLDAAGDIVAVEGFFVDVTDALRREVDCEAHDAVAGGALAVVIEQAKGVLIVVYGVDADAAFELLRWHSQHRNLKLGHCPRVWCTSSPRASLTRRRSAAASAPTSTPVTTEKDRPDRRSDADPRVPAARRQLSSATTG